MVRVALSPIEVGRYAEGVQEYGAEEDIWAQEGHGKRGIEKTTLIRSLTICTPHQILFR